MNYSWLDFTGNVEVAIVLVEYWRLQSGRTSPDRLGYSLANSAGAGLILVSLTGNVCGGGARLPTRSLPSRRRHGW